MKRRALQAGVMGLIFAFSGALLAYIWAQSPVTVDKDIADPAVAYLNQDGRLAGQMKEGYFASSGNSLHYVEAGSGDPIVFLHGFPSYWFSFARQIEALSSSHRIIAIDGLGAGRSDAPIDHGQYRLDTMADHVVALLDVLEIESAHLVGHDWGAAFAFGIAQRHPERVKSVTGIAAPPQEVLIEAMATSQEIRAKAAYVERLKRANSILIVATGGHKQVWKGAYEPLVSSGAMTPEEGAIFREVTSDPRRLNAHINWYRANIPAPDEIERSAYWPARRARLEMPALLIWGTQDRVFDPLYAELFLERGDMTRVLEIESVGHWPQFERAEIVTDAIKTIVEDASAAEQETD